VPLPRRTNFIVHVIGVLDLPASSAGTFLPRSPAGPNKDVLELAGFRGAPILCGPAGESTLMTGVVC